MGVFKTKNDGTTRLEAFDAETRQKQEELDGLRKDLEAAYVDGIETAKLERRVVDIESILQHRERARAKLVESVADADLEDRLKAIDREEAAAKKQAEAAAKLRIEAVKAARSFLEKIGGLQDAVSALPYEHSRMRMPLPAESIASSLELVSRLRDDEKRDFVINEIIAKIESPNYRETSMAGFFERRREFVKQRGGRV